MEYSQSGAASAANDNDEYRFYVYAWLYPDGRPFYVGKGNGRRDRRPKNNNTIFKRIIAKISNEGGSPRVVRWQDGLREEDAFRLEAAYIKLFGRRDINSGILANMTEGGEGTSGLKFSDERRAVMAEASRGKKYSLGIPKSDEHRAKMSVVARNRSSETRAKMSEAQRGKVHSAETRAKLSAAGSGKPKSAEHRAKIGEASLGNKSMLGKEHSAETRAAISLAARMAAPRSGYKGAYLHSVSHKPVATIKVNGVKRHLGCHPTLEDAARAYDAAAIEAWGAGNCYLNFPSEFAAISE